jgi:hypothetical protein
MTSRGCGAVSSTISRMMWRGVRNCPFCRCRDLAEHVFVEITFSVAVLHWDVVEAIHESPGGARPCYGKFLLILTTIMRHDDFLSHAGRWIHLP